MDKKIEKWTKLKNGQKKLKNGQTLKNWTKLNIGPKLKNGPKIEKWTKD